MSNLDQISKTDEILEILTLNTPESKRNTYNTEEFKTSTFVPFFDRVKPQEQEASISATQLRNFESKLKMIENFYDQSKAI